MRHLSAVLAAAVLGGTLVLAQMQPLTAHADLTNATGQTIGRATLTDGPNGVLVHVELTSAPAGVHAFHIHAVGQCAPPFTSAGGHFNPAHHQHGFMNPQGRHAGDLPNITVPADGRLTFDAFADGVTLKAGETSLFDADGSALVMHGGADDYASDPAGNAGPRIACGVVTRN
jgi:superoxide dismutase, Cu-Zn family